MEVLSNYLNLIAIGTVIIGIITIAICMVETE